MVKTKPCKEARCREAEEAMGKEAPREMKDILERVLNSMSSKQILSASPRAAAERSSLHMGHDNISY